MSSSLKESVPYATRLVDPRFNSSGLRREFRLDRDTAYYSDLRLINIGFSSASGATVYNGLLGAEVPIRSIFLLDGEPSLKQSMSFRNGDLSKRSTARTTQTSQWDATSRTII